MDPRLALFGLVGGILIGISGVGGGSLMTPLLILVVGVKPLVAIGTDLAYSVPTKLLGAYVHRGQGTVDRRVVLFLGLGGVPGTIAGLVLLRLARMHLGAAQLDEVLRRGIGLLLFLVAMAVLLTPLLARRPGAAASRSAAGDAWLPQTAATCAGLGALAGFLVGLTSIGAGSITVPALYLLLPRLGLRRLVGSNVTFAAIIVPVAALVHLRMGNVNPALTANLLVGSLPGVWIGSKLCARLPDSVLRPAIAGALVLAGVRMV